MPAGTMINEKKINGKTHLAGLIGWPVGHSRSPLLYNAWCQQYGVNGAYVPLPVSPVEGELEIALRGLVAAGFMGVSVTIPHKETAFGLCDEVTEHARRAGAANLLSFRKGRIIGDCTDGTGFYAYLCSVMGESALTSKPGNALILGAGGAARAIAARLQDKGFTVFITNRTAERATSLAQALNATMNTAITGSATVKKVQTIAWSHWPERLGEMSLLVNATSLGMGAVLDKNSISPEEEYWERAFSAVDEAHSLCVADIVYAPLLTPLLHVAQKRGWPNVDGLGMLIYQACEGFYQWFGVRVTPDEKAFALLRQDLGVG